MRQPLELPPDFDRDAYLRLNPDVAAAGVDPGEHWLQHGVHEGRRWRDVEIVRGMAGHIAGAPGAQAVLDLFAGEWSSALPPHLGLRTEPGRARLFEDARIDFVARHLGPIEGARVLEIVPLEAGHTYRLHSLGAASIDAVESGRRAFLKCLCIKEILGLDRARFRLGDAIAFLEETEEHWDIAVASGILYHMTEPLGLLDALAAHADRLFLWTHYYEAEAISRHPEAALFGTPEPVGDRPGAVCVRRAYPGAAVDWAGFSGGRAPHAVWLTRQTIVDELARKGFDTIEIGFDDLDHPNGPAIAAAARREC